MTYRTNEKCKFITDHQVQWAGDGYFCSKCMTQFVDKKAILEEVKNLVDERMTITVTRPENLDENVVGIFKDWLEHFKKQVSVIIDSKLNESL